MPRKRSGSTNVSRKYSGCPHQEGTTTSRRLFPYDRLATAAAAGLCHPFYNHNARYYTIVGIPQFDSHGIWAYRKIRFSKWGTLTKTIVGVIEDSAAGMTAEQLQQLLQFTNA